MLLRSESTTAQGFASSLSAISNTPRERAAFAVDAGIGQYNLGDLLNSVMQKNGIKILNSGVMHHLHRASLEPPSEFTITALYSGKYFAGMACIARTTCPMVMALLKLGMPTMILACPVPSSCSCTSVQKVTLFIASNFPEMFPPSAGRSSSLFANVIRVQQHNLDIHYIGARRSGFDMTVLSAFGSKILKKRV